jgi:biotin transport system substrate-specific component
MSAHASSETLLARSLSGAALATPIRVVVVAVAVALMAAASQFTAVVPLTSVPFTLTPMVVLLTSAALGSRLGVLTQMIYIVLGAAGLPVFAPSAVLPPGLLRLVGPTGGYLLAYPLAAFAIGRLAESGWDRRYVTCLAAMLVGLLIIYAGGVSWLIVGMGASPTTALVTGAVPFLVPDLLKAAAAAMLLPQAWRILRQG